VGGSQSMFAPDPDVLDSHERCTTMNVNKGGSSDLRLRKVERGFSPFKRDICARLDGLEDILHSRLPALEHTTSRTVSCVPAATQLHAPAPMAALTNNVVSHISNPAAEIDPKNVATVQLGDNKFSFDRTTVDDPPAKHFSEDIEEFQSSTGPSSIRPRKVSNRVHGKPSESNGVIGSLLLKNAKNMPAMMFSGPSSVMLNQVHGSDFNKSSPP